MSLEKDTNRTRKIIDQLDSVGLGINLGFQRKGYGQEVQSKNLLELHKQPAMLGVMSSVKDQATLFLQ